MLVGSLPEAGARLRPGEIVELWSRARPTFVGIIVMVTVLAFIADAFAGIVAPTLLRAWLSFMGANVAVLCVLLAAFRVPSWPTAMPARFWVGATHVISLLFCLGIALSVWVLLPPAGDALRMFAIFLYLWFIAMVMMVGGNATATIGCIGLLASMIAFVQTYEVPYRGPLSVFLLMVGVALIGIRRLIWRAADEAAAARSLSDRAAESLAAALAIVRSERDAKTRFIASASHDLQQPVQAARLFMERALREPDELARSRAVQRAGAAFDAVGDLLESMLVHLRLEADSMAVCTQEIDLDALLETVAASRAELAAAAGVRLRTAPSRIRIHADYRLLERAIGNLLNNALQHAGATRVLLAARLRGDRVSVYVIDDGRGVAAIDVDGIFEAFKQGSEDKAPGRGGFGLGLASARRLTELQGGEVVLDRRWASGAAFVVRLPRGSRQPIAASLPTIDERRCAAV